LAGHPSIGPHRGDIEQEIDGLADEDVARFENLVPDKAVVRALELSTERERDSLPEPSA